jgi:hypothetical protein
MTDFSKRALLEFIDSSIAKGRMNVNTGGGVRAACKKILEQVELDADVRAVDVKKAVVQYNNRHPNELSGDSLRVYESRVRGAIDSFAQAVTDPTGFKFPSKSKTNGSVIRRSRPIKSIEVTAATAAASPSAADTPTTGEDAPGSHGTGIATELTLKLPFPLRSNFLATVVIPRDLTRDEAKRLALFIDALAQDSPKP